MSPNVGLVFLPPCSATKMTRSTTHLAPPENSRDAFQLLRICHVIRRAKERLAEPGNREKGEPFHYLSARFSPLSKCPSRISYPILADRLIGA